ncbi:hypothetical protein GCM10027579_12310 [Calidifontibacter terrae]
MLKDLRGCSSGRVKSRRVRRDNGHVGSGEFLDDGTPDKTSCSDDAYDWAANRVSHCGPGGTRLTEVL